MNSLQQKNVHTEKNYTQKNKEESLQYTTQK